MGEAGGSNSSVVSNNRRFVQFPHPGREQSPDSGDWKEWSRSTRENHARKFVEIGGAWLEAVDTEKLKEGKLWAWTEWEAESRVLCRFEPSNAGSPRYLWEPTWRPKQDYRELHNTDPSIFEGFYYSDCRQKTKGLRGLERGSVIVFGSMVNGRWVVDTVLVVGDYVDHTSENYKALLAGRVPPYYWDVTLAPTHQDVEPPSNRRLYVGATWDVPVDGMFSFFPCLPAERKTPFARPYVELCREYFTPSLSRTVKGCSRILLKSTLKELWSSIAEQVLDQGLLLGVRADSPACGSPRGGSTSISSQPKGRRAGRSCGPARACRVR